MSMTTVDKCLNLLQHLAQSDQPCGVVELARDLGQPKANVFRWLNTLVDHGYVKQREDARYAPTLKLWELGSMIVARTSLSQSAYPQLEHLAAVSGESSHLAVLEGTESIYVDKRNGPHPITGFTRIGTRAPAHCCATGKIELALRTARPLDEFPEELPVFTAATLRTREALAEELRAIRAAGVAVNRGEWVEDVWGVAAAIRDHMGTVCASIGIWGPRQRISNRLDVLLHEVRSAADRVSRSLGCPADRLQPKQGSST